MNEDTAQEGLFAEPITSAHYLEYAFKNNAGISSIIEACRLSLDCKADCYINIAFGAEAWEKLNSDWKPADLVSFTQLDGNNGYNMPSNQSDIFFWIHGDDQGEVVNAMLHVNVNMQNIAELVSDINGFKNKQSRDLTGFVDGTENPTGDVRLQASLIPEDKLGAGGSYVFTQQWQHNLDKFNHLSVTEQEKVIGRTKVTDEELQGEDNPPTSHVSRTDAKVDGVPMKIFRRSTPYANANDHGLYFLAFASELRRIRIQLDRMLGNTDDGYSDHLMQFSTPKSGSYWFMPSKTDLNTLLNP